MTCPKYPKVDTLFDRDKETFKVDETKIRRPEFLIPTEWIVTEKIDGMNIRVSLELECSNIDHSVEIKSQKCCDTWEVKYYGRNDNSQFPPQMLEYLQKILTLEKMKPLWRGKSNCDRCSGTGRNVSELAFPFPYACNCIDSYQITLYGEGYGAGIQKGGSYNKEKAFRIFDVFIGETWLSHENVESVTDQLGISNAPWLRDKASLAEIVDIVKEGFTSIVSGQEGDKGTLAEGIVAQTTVPLFNSRGQRLQFKLKTKDFA